MPSVVKNVAPGYKGVARLHALCLLIRIIVPLFLRILKVRAPHVVYMHCVARDKQRYDIGIPHAKFYSAPFKDQKTFWDVFRREFLAYLNYESKKDSVGEQYIFTFL